MTIDSEAWWQSRAEHGCPLVETQANGGCQLTFYWRQPPDKNVDHVVIDVWSLTPHPTQGTTGMVRLANTRIWIWQVCVAEPWIGSYFFVPVTAAQYTRAAHESRRHWWIKLINQYAQHDPLNTLHYRGPEGRMLSGLHPHPPSLEAKGHDLQTLDWASPLLGRNRNVWLHTTGGGPDTPLVILLDGQIWAQSLSLTTDISALTQAGHLPPAVYLMLDAIDSSTRYREMTCNPQFWQALHAELLPLAATHARFSPRAHNTVVAGQSLGGLAACYAALTLPHLFGRVLSQSGSFWWRGEDGLSPPLSEHIPHQAPPQRWYLEVGQYEDTMIDDNRHMSTALAAAGQRVTYREFRGGHDWLCWRDGLLHGLQILLEEHHL